MAHPVREELDALGIISAASVEPFYHRVRDREDIAALRDADSGVIFLDRSDHVQAAHYEQIPGASYWGGATRAEALNNYREDDERRAGQFAGMVAGRAVLDVGCGTGGFMDLIKPAAKSVAGVEPQAYMRNELARLGYTMYAAAAEAPKAAYDTATLFHVLEHIAEPLRALTEVKELLRPGGTVVVEVPHARDVLLQLESFKQFSLWSEHVVLHTRQSLQTYLQAAGFSEVAVAGYQRYPLANHLGWLVEGKPGGQKRVTPPQGAAERYEQMLVESDQTDTIIATARRV